MFKDIEITKRFDGKLNVWALINDPTIEPEVHETSPYPLTRWVVVDVLDKIEGIQRYRAKGTNLKILVH